MLEFSQGDSHLIYLLESAVELEGAIVGGGVLVHDRS